VRAGDSSAAIWFTRTRNKVDLTALDDAIKGAKKGILFLMFQPGGTGALKTIDDLDSANPSRLLCVVLTACNCGGLTPALPLA